MTYQIKGYFHKLQESEISFMDITGEEGLGRKKKKKKKKQGVTVKKGSMALHVIDIVLQEPKQLGQLT